ATASVHTPPPWSLPALRLQPDGTPLIVTVPSVSSLSCLASLIDKAIVLAASISPLVESLASRVGFSATALTVTLNEVLVVAEPTAPASVAVAVTARATTVSSVPAGATIDSEPRSATASVHTPPPWSVPALRLQPDGTPLIATVPSVSWLSCFPSLIDKAIVLAASISPL